MGRSQESFNKKEVRSKKEKKRKEKAERRQAKKEGQKASPDDMIAYVDENGVIMDTPPDPENKQEIKAEDIIIDTPPKEDIADDSPDEGVVTYYNDSKGYGFIRNIHSKESVFFHANDVMEPVKEGNLVTFKQGKGNKGPVAMEVAIKK